MSGERARKFAGGAGVAAIVAVLTLTVSVWSRSVLAGAVAEAQAGAPTEAQLLLRSFDGHPDAAAIREYVLPDGTVGRQYATNLGMNEAPTAVTGFHRERLLRDGWKTVGEHAAVSSFARGPLVVSILRAGPRDPGLPPGARPVWSTTAPSAAKFFYTIEVGRRETPPRPAAPRRRGAYA